MTTGPFFGSQSRHRNRLRIYTSQVSDKGERIVSAPQSCAAVLTLSAVSFFQNLLGASDLSGLIPVPG